MVNSLYLKPSNLRFPNGDTKFELFIRQSGPVETDYTTVAYVSMHVANVFINEKWARWFGTEPDLQKIVKLDRKYVLEKELAELNATLKPCDS